MKMKLLAGLLGAVILVAGCVSTASGGKTAAVPFTKDKFVSRYKVAPEIVIQAAKEVVKNDGVVTNEGINYAGTNEVKYVQGKVNEAKVWVSVSVVEKDLTEVIVQVRRGSGGSDLALANQINKEIAIKLAKE